MKTQRSQHGMDLDGAFSGRTGMASGEFGSAGVARSGNMGSNPPVANTPILSGTDQLSGGMGAVDVSVDTSTVLTALLAIGGGLFLWYKFGR